MKTPLEILHKYFHHFNSERTRDLVVRSMEEYAKIYHETEVKKLQQHSVMQGLLLAAGLSHNKITMTEKEQASSLVEYFWTGVEEFKQYETIRMTKEMAKDCAIKVAEEAKIEIGNFDRTDGYVRIREDFWDAVIVEIRAI